MIQLPMRSINFRNLKAYVQFRVCRSRGCMCPVRLLVQWGMIERTPLIIHVYDHIFEPTSATSPFECVYAKVRLLSNRFTDCVVVKPPVLDEELFHEISWVSIIRYYSARALACAYIIIFWINKLRSDSKLVHSWTRTLQWKPWLQRCLTRAPHDGCLKCWNTRVPSTFHRKIPKSWFRSSSLVPFADVLCESPDDMPLAARTS